MRYTLLSLAALGLGACAEMPAPTEATPGITALRAAGEDSKWSAISASNSSSCGLDRSGNPFCWGSNGYGQLGDGTTSPHYLPAPVVGRLKFALLETGYNEHSCGITTEGVAYCWGRNDYGQLGAPSTDDCGGTVCSMTPIRVSGGHRFSTRPGSLDLGDLHSCALTRAGAAWCWGENAQGPLGNGTPSNMEQTPVAVTGGFTFSSISAGNRETCGVTTAGAGMCWGLNFWGSFGDGTRAGAASPVAVVGGLTLATITVGGAHACGVTTAGAAYCWGLNNVGALGAATTDFCDDGFGNLYECSTTPVAVAGGLTFRTGVGSIGAGTTHACGVATTRSIYCWGRGDQGQLGNGGTANSGAPTQVLNVHEFEVVSAGSGHTCGIVGNKRAYCWGVGGPLGDGSSPAYVGSTIPVKVH